MILRDPYQAGGVRGSIGGATFSIWRGTIFARVRTKPARRGRTTQPRNRSILGFLSRQWGDLTAAQRVLWENYALNHPEENAFGQEFIMSGINAYVKLNHTVVRLFGGGALTTEPPVSDPAAAINNFGASTGSGNPGEIDLVWSLLGTGSADDKIEIRVAGPFISPGRQEVFERKKFFSNVNGDVVAETLAGLVEQQYYWIFIRYVDEFGQTTAWENGQATPMLTP